MPKLRVLFLLLALAWAGPACSEPQTPPEPSAVRQSAPAPAALQRRLEQLVAPFGGDAGVAVRDLQQGWTAEVNGRERFPQQSVYKVWLAAAVMEMVERGDLGWRERVLVTPDDVRFPYRPPIAAMVGSSGYPAEIAELVRYAIVYSDNGATDALLKRIGGPRTVQRFLDRNGLRDIRFDRTERGVHNAQDALRAEVDAAPPHRRKAIVDAWNAGEDSATPLATVDGLQAIWEGRLPSPEGANVLLDMMDEARGHTRLRRGAPAEWRVAHKNGSGGGAGGMNLGHNDVGVMAAPNGRAWAVAVYTAGTTAGPAERDRLAAEVARAVVEFSRSQPEPGSSWALSR